MACRLNPSKIGSRAYCALVLSFKNAGDTSA
jgi:hypothetical protein